MLFAMSDSFDKSNRNRVKRMPERGHYDRATIYPIVDAGLICHVGFVHEGQPFVIPTIHARVDDHVYFHGSKMSRLLQVLASGAPVCVTITHLDGLVLARSAFHSSMNYRSATLYGHGEMVEDAAEKWEVLKTVTEHVAPGRWADVRTMTEKEMGATLVARVVIEQASAKIRVGPPKDDEEDYALPIWAGVLPLTQVAGAPIDDPRLLPGLDAPSYASRYRRPA